MIRIVTSFYGSPMFLNELTATKISGIACRRFRQVARFLQTREF